MARTQCPQSQELHGHEVLVQYVPSTMTWTLRVREVKNYADTDLT